MKDETFHSCHNVSKRGVFFPVSLKISRKRDRQLGNHSLFTEGLEGRDGREEGVGEKRKGGVKLGAIRWTNSRWAGEVLILMTDMLLSLEQRW